MPNIRLAKVWHYKAPNIPIMLQSFTTIGYHMAK